MADSRISEPSGYPCTYPASLEEKKINDQVVSLDLEKMNVESIKSETSLLADIPSIST